MRFCKPLIPVFILAPAAALIVHQGQDEGRPGASAKLWDDTAAQNEALGLQAVFESGYAAKVTEVFSSLNQPAILTVAGTIDRVLVNFLLQAQRAAKESNTQITVVNAVLDAATMQSCLKVQQKTEFVPNLHIVCLDLANWLPDCPSRSMYLFVKPVIFREAVRSSSHGVLMMDLDIVLYRDLLDHAVQQWKERSRVILMTGTEGNGCCNTGSVLATKESSLPILDLWLQENVRQYRCDNLGDQAALVHVIKNGLDRINATSEQVALLPKSTVLQECNKCHCEGGCRACSLGAGPMALHYNCVNAHVDLEHELGTHGDLSVEVDHLMGKKIKPKGFGGSMRWAVKACNQKK